VWGKVDVEEQCCEEWGDIKRKERGALNTRCLGAFLASG
jgi:hypothetical protein